MSSTSPPVKDFEKIFEENDEYTTPPYVPSEEVTRPTNKTRTVLFSHPSHQDDGMEKLTKPNDSSDFSSRQMPHMKEPNSSSVSACIAGSVIGPINISARACTRK